MCARGAAPLERLAPDDKNSRRCQNRLPQFIEGEGGPCPQEPASGLKSLTCSLRVRCSIAEGTAPRRRLPPHYAFDNITLRGPSSIKEARNLS
jgi:hypothetical protein